MKLISTLLLSFALLFVSIPQVAYAQENVQQTQEFDMVSYLNEVSSIRGFEVKDENINLALAMFGKTKEDSNSADMIAFLGDVIKADLSNLSDIYNKYSLNNDSLVKLLSEYGEELNDYIYLNELDKALEFYTDSNDTTKEADFDVKLATYLENVSTERGFIVTEDDINSYLSEYFTVIDDFKSVSEMSEYLGEIIKSDLSNLDYFDINYGLEQDTLLQLIAENNLTIDDFIYIGQLEEFIWTSSNTPELNFSMYMDILKQIGLTEDELKNLENHFLSLTDYLTSTEGQAHLEDLSTRMLSFAQELLEKGMVDENYKLNDDEISEFASLYEELLTSVRLNVVFSIIKDGIKTEYSIADMMRINEYLDADYMIAIYNDKSELLADTVLTSEFINENFNDLIDEVSDLTESDTNSDVVSDKNTVSVKTVKGGELPKTSGNYLFHVLLGIMITITGIILYLKLRTGKNGFTENEI